MSIQFTCVCGESITVPQSKIGHKIKCDNCSSVLRVPNQDNHIGSNPMSDMLDNSTSSKLGAKNVKEDKIFKIHRSIKSNLWNNFYLFFLVSLSAVFYVFCSLNVLPDYRSSAQSYMNGFIDSFNARQAAVTIHYIPVCHLFAAILLILALIKIISMLIWAYQQRYKLTTARIIKYEGILSRDIMQILLIRIKDLNLHQSFIQRMFNVGSVEVISSDETTPDLRIHNINKPAKVYENIHTAWQKAIKDRGLVMW